MRILVEGLRYDRSQAAFIEKQSGEKLEPYAHQLKTLACVREAIKQNATICIENASVTGSGKTLANFAAAILDGTRTCGIYPTNELLLDQHISIHQFLPTEITILDSQGMDAIMEDNVHMRTHAQALAWATGDDMRTAILTNPDVLHLAMYNLYGQMFSTFAKPQGARVFQHILSSYPVIAFDEFHLYSAKQIANAAFIMGTAKELAPDKPHIFIFSSATPQPQFKHYVRRLGLETLCVTDTPTAGGRVVCEPVDIELLPANLLSWQGGDTIRAALDTILAWADSYEPAARGVFIVDSVYEAKRLAEELRQRYTATEVGEVHGYMDDDARASALQRRFSVGTTTIDVGIDLTDLKSKEFLVCEARSAAQAIQRIGRLGRRGREPQDIHVPNRVWLAAPEYVCSYVEQHGENGGTIGREQLNELLNEAYLGYEDFLAYTKRYSPLEAVAACERILPQYFEDTKAGAQEKLHRLVSTLYDKEVPANQDQARQSYTTYRKRQLKVWRDFGSEIDVGTKLKNTGRWSKKYYLSDLESFRGGLESDFTVAIYDDLDERLGLKPVKTYALPFVLRRTRYKEVSLQQFTELLRRRHPAQADTWLKELERQRNLLGYVHVIGLVEGKANEMYFEVGKSHIEGRFQQVVRLTGLSIDGDNIQLLDGKGGINGELRKRSLNCWISERHSFSLSQSLSLPPLFAIYPLHAINISGKPSAWSIAFGLDAFLLASIAKRRRWSGTRSDNTAIII
ncbi:MAG: type I-D CRISPR-associated helicase Cas3' [Ktedonobacteraceae bacterium]